MGAEISLVVFSEDLVGVKHNFWGLIDIKALLFSNKPFFVYLWKVHQTDKVNWHGVQCLYVDLFKNRERLLVVKQDGIHVVTSQLSFSRVSELSFSEDAFNVVLLDHMGSWNCEFVVVIHVLLKHSIPFCVKKTPEIEEALYLIIILVNFSVLIATSVFHHELRSCDLVRYLVNIYRTIRIVIWVS